MKRALLPVQPILLLAMAALAAHGPPPPPRAGPSDGPESGGSLKTVRIGAALEKSNVPPILAQGNVLPAQSVSAVDVSGDGRSIAITTVAFRHDRNFWLLSADGKQLGARQILPWAPFQVA